MDATIALLEEGDLRPTAPRVAAEAAVSVRSIFHHFEDLESLHAAVADRLAERVSLLMAPIAANLPLEERVERFVLQRARLLESVSPIRRAADLHGQFSSEITARLQAGQALLRDEIEHTFGPELSAVGADRGQLLDALDVALSWRAWEGLRTGLGRDEPDTRAVVRRLVLALLVR